MDTHFYLTTTLPYVNAAPHLGHAFEFVLGDARARFEALRGKRVFFNSGVDEYGTKIYQRALSMHMQPQEYVDHMLPPFTELLGALSVVPTRFIRTTDADHKRAVHHMWSLCVARGDVYKKEHEGRYCIGCELFKSEEDLVNGECPFHPGRRLELVREENYFFRFSRYGDALLELYRSHDDFILPASRKEELVQFVSRGLHDFSISRSRDRLSWGIEVPDDNSQVIYVWFDALTNYLTTIGWPDNPSWSEFWPVVQLAGKDNLRQQGAIWQAMLLSAGVPPSKQLCIHGFLTSQGQKMSKTLGNVIDPQECIQEYGGEFLRYYLLRHAHSFEDTDVTKEAMRAAYDADLVHGLGNMVARVMRLGEEYLEPSGIRMLSEAAYAEPFLDAYTEAFSRFDIRSAAQCVWDSIRSIDKRIATTEPYRLLKTDTEAGKGELRELVSMLARVTKHLEPLMPSTASRIQEALRRGVSPGPLFPKR